MRKISVAFLNTHPIQYFAPLYAYLNGTEELSITALYLSNHSVRGAADRAFAQVVKWDVDLLSGYNVHFVAGAERRGEPGGFLSFIAPAIWHDVRTGGFDALVVHGHTPAAIIIAIFAAKAAGIPIFMRSETHLRLDRSALKKALRKLIMTRLFRHIDGVLAIGSANAAFYREMNVPDERIFSMPYTVDNARFIAGSRMPKAERAELRSSLGVKDDRPIVLYAAKFQQRKRPDDLIRAVAQLMREGIIFHIVMIGSGIMEVELRALATLLGIKNIHFHGFVNQTALPKFYSACDVFVLPSENEPWGLAVNEAMCAGLPIVASSEIGCVADLVHQDVNGRTFAAGDIEGLAGALRPLLGDEELRQRMSAASRRIISRWSYAECREGLRAALASVGLGAVPDPDEQQSH